MQFYNIKSVETTYLKELGVCDMAVFAELTADIVGAGLFSMFKPEFGYGNFDD
jgi:hypothetical protein